MKRRELLAAGIVRDIRFRDENEYEIYLYGLDDKHKNYKIMEEARLEDGTVLARILEGYKTTPLIPVERY